MARQDAKRPSKRNILFISLMLMALAMIIAFFSVRTALTPKRYAVAEGMVAPETIYATHRITDESTTGVLRERARNGVETVYQIDSASVDQLYFGAESFFDTLVYVRSAAEKYKAGEGAYTAADWSSNLDAERKKALGAMTKPSLDEMQLCTMLASSATEMQLLRDTVLTKLETALKAGLKSGDVEAIRATCVREINAMTGLSVGLKQIAESAVNAYMAQTLVVNAEETERARDAAASAVADVVVRKGEAIVEAGSEITGEQMALLEQLDLVERDDNGAGFDIGLAVAVVSAFGIFTAYLWFIRREVILDTKRMIILGVLISITMLLALISSTLDPRISPALIAIMLTALLVDEDTAFALTILIGTLSGAMSGGQGDAIFSSGAFLMFSSTIAAGAASIFALKRLSSRGSIIASGTIGGAAAAVMNAALLLMIAGTEAGDILLGAGWSIGSALVSTLLVVGSLSIWENMFDIATHARLNELTNTGHPLVRQLMTEAPGTYQHSMMVAALAEGAAEAIGADPLLARAGGYYHDVGKLRRPLYFMENQKPGENIHDKLPPAESASIIISHQKDGVTLLTRYRLPSAVIRIASEHHGNSLMTYFYHKAQGEGDSKANIKAFRYLGNKPSTRESAIVMLADSCEAAVRSLGETNCEQVEQMVHKVIYSKMADPENMMANAPVTLAEFAEIERSFIRTFGALMHGRIEYPDTGKED